MSLFPPERFQDPALVARLVEVRRDLHAHPELGMEEVRTAGIVAARLTELGIPHQTGIANTGVVGLVEGGEPGPTVMLRADMDALPLTEENDVPYRSTRPGAMHACGHDAHVAMLLGAAEFLVEAKERLPGRVKLCFQPAEEGPGGAEPMVAAGVLKDPDVDFAIGLHVWTKLPVGKAGIVMGPAMAAVDMFEVHILAKGGHGAVPQQTPDPIVTAAAVIQAWQAIMSRERDPLEPGVLSVCQINGGSADNIIPNRVTLRGTVRTFSEELREHIPRAMERILKGVCSAYGAGYELVWKPFYPSTSNDPRVVGRMRDVIREMTGRLILDEELKPVMGGEDMSFFLREVPGAFALLGAATEGTEGELPHHNSHFDIDERCLPLGVELAVRTAERLLRKGIGE